mmetsp:Transcript_37991/g.62521  ORF Transcript_37991/g.62521 Transcript_37991/m.62521 type:complete len:306 (-) Transcript_37991:295-1212(-)
MFPIVSLRQNGCFELVEKEWLLLYSAAADDEEEEHITKQQQQQQHQHQQQQQQLPQQGQLQAQAGLPLQPGQQVVHVLGPGNVLYAIPLQSSGDGGSSQAISLQGLNQSAAVAQVTLGSPAGGAHFGGGGGSGGGGGGGGVPPPLPPGASYLQQPGGGLPVQVPANLGQLNQFGQAMAQLPGGLSMFQQQPPQPPPAQQQPPQQQGHHQQQQTLPQPQQQEQQQQSLGLSSMSAPPPPTSGAPLPGASSGGAQGIGNLAAVAGQISSLTPNDIVQALTPDQIKALLQRALTSGGGVPNMQQGGKV